jgi:serine phosphatase RsbU (regulator of sigma subunit)
MLPHHPHHQQNNAKLQQQTEVRRKLQHAFAEKTCELLPFLSLSICSFPRLYGC